MATSQVCVFVDVGNQFFCINKKWPGRKLNYQKYMEKATTFGSISRAFAYGTQVNDAAVKFITALHHLGYEPHYKQVEKNTWFSWDVGLAMDIVKLHEKADVVIIGNSNRNITPVITWAKEKGIRVIIISCGISKDIKDACDQWIEISEDMLEDIIPVEEPIKEQENEKEEEEEVDVEKETTATETTE